VLARLKEAAKESVTPWGFPGGAFPAGVAWRSGGAPEAVAADSAAQAAPGPDPAGYSGTNVHEAGADEPDLVKTDGRRIVTVTGGVLRVVDPVSREMTGSVRLGPAAGEPGLLLSGHRAMVLMTVPARTDRGLADRGQVGLMPVVDMTVRLVAVDLAGPDPVVVDSYTIDGSLVDARQVGATARIVVRSRPRIDFPYRPNATDAQRLRDNRAAIAASTIDDWLPRWSTQTGAERPLDCGALRKPAAFSGSSLLTVLSFDVGADRFGPGDPTTIVADGDLVYSNGTSLYVANDQSWRGVRADAETVVYRFDITGSGPPRYVAAGSVPGGVLNQYAMSEFAGHLRVAVTEAGNSSSVYALRAADMTRVGMVGGLGKGERIYAVRFAGAVGYVVTFRQTDPLYTVDLHDPSAPAVRGELKINGYSAYLHPLDDGRLVGVGQDADDRGWVLGSQVSVFDVTDLADPRRVAQHRVPGGYSEVEHAPHAFLYWPPSGLLVVPVSSGARQEMLALRVSGSGLTELGAVRHPANVGDDPMIRRSLMVSGTLWTVSEAGMQATDPTSMRSQDWIPFL
jgi:hypothetical protein